MANNVDAITSAEPLLNNREVFIASVFPYAKKSADILKINKGITIDPLWITAQWAHETGYGQNKGAKQNNLAGLWAYPNSPYGTSGKVYNTLDDFVVDYTTTLSNKRYSGISTAQNVTDFASALKAGGYATDPNYAYAGTWTEAVKIGESLKTNQAQADPLNWYDLYRIDPATGEKVKVSWKNFFLGTTIENTKNEDGSSSWVVKDNTKLDSDPTKEQSLINFEGDWTNQIAYALLVVMIFVLVLFFLYGSLLKGTPVDDLVKTGRKAVTGI
jgi:hypothetical protein